MVAKEAGVDEREVLSMMTDADNWLSTITDACQCESLAKLMIARIHRLTWPGGDAVIAGCRACRARE